MKNIKQLVPALGVLLCVSLSCTLVKEKFTNGTFKGIETPRLGVTPDFDPSAPLPSTGAVALRQFAVIDPSVAVLIDSVEAAERTAMKKAQAEFSYRPSDFDLPGLPVRSSRTASEPTSAASLATMAMFQAGGGDEGQKRIDTARNLGTYIAYLGNMFGRLVRDGSQTGLDIPPETVDGVTVTPKLEVSRHEDGSISSSLSMKIDGDKNGIRFKIETEGKVDGQLCPNSDGQVSLTVTLHMGMDANGSVYNQDLTAFVRAVVDENAGIASETFDVTQATRKADGGRQLYIETGQTFSRQGTTDSASNYREIRTSSEVRPSDYKISEDGLSAAYSVGKGALDAAKHVWSNSGCTFIEATSPGTVGLNSTSLIPVTVRHKIEGAEVPSKLSVVLKGGTSVAPTVIPQTAGTLTYVAPGEAAQTATISLAATSRRGRATLDLTASTGGNSYHIAGGLDDFQTSADVCDIMKPFALTGGGFTVQFSGGMEGTYTYAGPYNAKGDGTYNISLPDGPGKSGNMVGGGSGQITGDKVYTGSGVEKYTLTPIAPCS